MCEASSDKEEYYIFLNLLFVNFYRLKFYFSAIILIHVSFYMSKHLFFSFSLSHFLSQNLTILEGNKKFKKITQIQNDSFHILFVIMIIILVIIR